MPIHVTGFVCPCSRFYTLATVDWSGYEQCADRKDGMVNDKASGEEDILVVV